VKIEVPLVVRAEDGRAAPVQGLGQPVEPYQVGQTRRMHTPAINRDTHSRARSSATAAGSPAGAASSALGKAGATSRRSPGRGRGPRADPSPPSSAGRQRPLRTDAKDTMPHGRDAMETTRH
jgi:hypothetical protein